MIRDYFKVLNNMITQNLLYYITGFILLLNIVIRVKPKIFINMSQQQVNILTNMKVIPTSLFNLCDVYLLLLFIITICFFLGLDFTNSMEELVLAAGGSKINKFMLRKLYTTLTLYIILYFISFINIYTLYKKLLPSNVQMIPLKEIIFFSFVTNVFIISLSLAILFITKSIPISIILITAYYLIEEALWRCKVTDKEGILGHIYQYYDYSGGEIIKVKTFYIFLSVILIFISYKLSCRKRTL